MTHRVLPTMNDVRKEHAKRLLTNLQNQKIHEFSDVFFEELVSTMGIEQAAQKLVSYILESNDVSGPDSIGITGERLKRFFFEVESGYEKRDQGKHKSGGFRRGKDFFRRSGKKPFGGSSNRGGDFRKKGGKRER